MIGKETTMIDIDTFERECQEEQEEVELIVGNYEWICPGCGTLNKENELPRDNTLECQNDDCRKSYGIRDYYHAYE